MRNFFKILWSSLQFVPLSLLTTLAMEFKLAPLLINVYFTEKVNLILTPGVHETLRRIMVDQKKRTSEQLKRSNPALLESQQRRNKALHADFELSSLSNDLNQPLQPSADQSLNSSVSHHRHASDASKLSQPRPTDTLFADDIKLRIEANTKINLINFIFLAEIDKISNMSDTIEVIVEAIPMAML